MMGIPLWKNGIYKSQQAPVNVIVIFQEAILIKIVELWQRQSSNQRSFIA